MQHQAHGDEERDDVLAMPNAANAAEVASQMVRPARSAAIHSPSGTRTPEVVPFQVKTTSPAKSTASRSGSKP